jgi:hypothetical protein
MKKDNFFVLGMLAMVLALGLAFVGCDNGGGGDEPYDGPKTIKITGFNLDIPVTTNHKTGESAKFLYVSVREPVDNGPRIANGQVKNPSGQDITFELFENSESWTGTGSYFILLEGPPKDSGRDGGRYWYSVNGVDPAPVDIKDAVTTLDFSDFVYTGDYTAG